MFLTSHAVITISLIKVCHAIALNKYFCLTLNIENPPKHNEIHPLLFISVICSCKLHRKILTNYLPIEDSDQPADPHMSRVMTEPIK